MSEIRARAIAADIHPLRAAAVRAVGGSKPRPFYAIEREVSVMMHGVKVSEELPHFVKLGEDPLFEFIRDVGDDDMVCLSPLGCAVLACLTDSPRPATTD